MISAKLAAFAARNGSEADARERRFGHCGRVIAVGDLDGRYAELAISPADAAALSHCGVIYSCGGEHDLHLNPGRRFTLEEVEFLLTAIARQKATVSKGAA